MKPTLEEFMQSDDRNRWVRFPGFAHLYVRKGPYVIDHVQQHDVIQIANVAARKRGKGAFRRLINFLLSRYPDYPIVVENAGPLMQKVCTHMGFQRLYPHTTLCPSYVIGAGYGYQKETAQEEEATENAESTG